MPQSVLDAVAQGVNGTAIDRCQGLYIPCRHERTEVLQLEKRDRVC